MCPVNGNALAMEEVRSSIEKIFDSFEASNRIEANARCLDYSFLNESTEREYKIELTMKFGRAAILFEICFVNSRRETKVERIAGCETTS